MRVFGCHLATKIDALSRLAPRTHFCWFLAAFWHPFGLLCAPFWPRLERFWLHFRSFWLLWTTLAPLWVSFSLILHRLALILKGFGLHPLFLAPQSAKYCKIDLGNQISYKVLLAILSSTWPGGELLPQATERRAVYRNVRLESS